MTSTLLVKYIVDHGHNDLDMVCNMLELYSDITIDSDELIRYIFKSHMHYRASNNIYRILLRDIHINIESDILSYLSHYCGHIGLMSMFDDEFETDNDERIVNCMDFLYNMSLGKYKECRWMIDKIPGFDKQFCYSAILNKKHLFGVNEKYMNILRILFDKYMIDRLESKICTIIILKTNMSCLMEHALWFVNIGK